MAKTNSALARLQASGGPLVVRAFGVYHGRGRVGNVTPPDYPRLMEGGRLLEYVLAYRSPDGEVADWVRVVREAQLGSPLAALRAPDRG